MRALLLSAVASILAIHVSARQITNFPSPPINFKQYSGYFDVGPQKNHHLHYWFLESARDPENDPVVVWLTGGPGCSGMLALLTEWGPFLVNPQPGPSGWDVSINEYSWNKITNILIIESPAGVGFSYSSDGNVNTDDQQTANDNFEALEAFFDEFPQFINNSFFVAGESYGGVYVPTLVEAIIDRKKEFDINLKGFLIGNGCVSRPLETDTLMQFAYTHNLINDQTWDQVRTSCCVGNIHNCKFHQFNGHDFCANFVADTLNTIWMSGMNPYGMYADCLGSDKNKHPIQKRYSHDVFWKTGKRPPSKGAYVPCIDDTPVMSFVNEATVRTALFIPTSLPKWQICSDAVADGYTQIYLDMHSRVKKAIDNGLRGLIYNGDTDLACNSLLGQQFTAQLGYPLTSHKKQFVVDGQVAGFHTQYGRAEFVSVRAAGHMVPTDKPVVALHILEAFLNEQKPY